MTVFSNAGNLVSVETNPTARYLELMKQTVLVDGPGTGMNCPVSGAVRIDPKVKTKLELP